MLGTIKIWNLPINKLVANLKQHSTAVCCLTTIRAYASDFSDADNNLLKKILKREQEKESAYLISGSLSNCSRQLQSGEHGADLGPHFAQADQSLERFR